MVENLPASVGDIRNVGLILGLGRSHGGGHATHCSILAWRIPWTEEPGGLQSMGLQESDRTVHACTRTSLTVLLILPLSPVWKPELVSQRRRFRQDTCRLRQV